MSTTEGGSYSAISKFGFLNDQVLIKWEGTQEEEAYVVALIISLSIKHVLAMTI